MLGDVSSYFAIEKSSKQTKMEMKSDDFSNLKQPKVEDKKVMSLQTAHCCLSRRAHLLTIGSFKITILRIFHLQFKNLQVTGKVKTGGKETQRKFFSEVRIRKIRMDLNVVTIWLCIVKTLLQYLSLGTT